MSSPKPVTIQLQRAKAGAGLFRQTLTSSAGATVFGWIVTNDGWSTGSGTAAGKPVVNIVQSPDGAGDPTGPPAAGGTGGTPAPVPAGLIKNIRCGIL